MPVVEMDQVRWHYLPNLVMSSEENQKRTRSGFSFFFTGRILHWALGSPGFFCRTVFEFRRLDYHLNVSGPRGAHRPSVWHSSTTLCQWRLPQSVTGHVFRHVVQDTSASRCVYPSPTTGRYHRGQRRSWHKTLGSVSGLRDSELTFSTSLLVTPGKAETIRQ